MSHDIVIAIINGAFLVIGGIITRQNQLIKRQAKKNETIAKATNEKVKTIEHQTNGVMNQKIKDAVHEVFRERHKDVDMAVVAEAINDLLLAHADDREYRERKIREAQEAHYGDD